MKERIEIEKRAENARDHMLTVPPRMTSQEAVVCIQRLQLEVLLDIRDEIRNRSIDDAISIVDKSLDHKDAMTRLAALRIAQNL